MKLKTIMQISEYDFAENFGGRVVFFSFYLRDFTAITKIKKEK